MDLATTRPEPTSPNGSGWWRVLRSWFEPIEPHLTRGPFSRWPKSADGILCLFVFAVSVVAVAVSAVADGESFSLNDVRDLSPIGYALLAVAAAALFLRRTEPVGVMTAVLLVMLLWAITEQGDGHELALIIAAYSVGRYTSDPRHSLVMLLAAGAISLVGTLIDPHQRVDVAPALLLPALPWYLGRRMRNRGDYVALLRERAARRAADEMAREARAVAEERARIARELHDVVAHRVSMMTVQAGAAKTVAGEDPAAAVEAMRDVELAGRQALGELRHLLGVLRPEASEPERLGPQRGLAHLPLLVDELEGTGATVTLSLPRPEPELPAAVDLSAYRIVQESITNIIKHAGDNPTVDISVDRGNGTLAIEVVNTIDQTEKTLPSSGYGIAGMHERVSLLGGSLSTGRVGEDRYRVVAQLPCEGSPR